MIFRSDQMEPELLEVYRRCGMIGVRSLLTHGKKRSFHGNPPCGGFSRGEGRDSIIKRGQFSENSSDRKWWSLRSTSALPNRCIRPAARARAGVWTNLRANSRQYARQRHD